MSRLLTLLRDKICISMEPCITLQRDVIRDSTRRLSHTSLFNEAALQSVLVRGHIPRGSKALVHSLCRIVHSKAHYKLIPTLLLIHPKQPIGSHVPILILSCCPPAFSWILMISCLESYGPGPLRLRARPRRGSSRRQWTSRSRSFLLHQVQQARRNGEG